MKEMKNNKVQVFNDGICKLARFGTHSDLNIVQRYLRYENRTVGSERFYKAAEQQKRIDKVIRIPCIPEPQATDVIIIGDDQYNVLQVQYIRDTNPSCWQLSIEKRKKRLEIYVNESAGVR